MYKKAVLSLPTKSNTAYSIDTNGVITNEDTGKVVGGRIKNGYHLICVSGTWKPIHRYVAETFIPKVEGKTYVNHINGIKSDNRVENLEWCTHTENMRHARDTGLQQPHVGTAHGMAKLTEETVHTVCKLVADDVGWKLVKAMNITGLTRSSFYSIKYKRTWKHITALYDF